MRCEDCKHWRQDQDDKTIGRCASEKFRIGIGRAAVQLDELGVVPRYPVAPSDLVSLGLVTGANFGCKHFDKIQ